MNTLFSKLALHALVAVGLLAGVPAGASASGYAAGTARAGTELAPNAASVQQVQDRGEWRRRHGGERRDFRRHHFRNEYRRPRHYQRRPYRGGFHRPPFYGGIIIAPQPRYVRPYRPPVRYGGSAHVRWCYARYRSYRAYDNTYQPYNGPRRQCYSPYV